MLRSQKRRWICIAWSITIVHFGESFSNHYCWLVDIILLPTTCLPLPLSLQVNRIMKAKPKYNVYVLLSTSRKLSFKKSINKTKCNKCGLTWKVWHKAMSSLQVWQQRRVHSAFDLEISTMYVNSFYTLEQTFAINKSVISI